MMRFKYGRIALILGILGMLTGCDPWLSSDLEDSSPFEGIPAKQLTSEANDALKKGEYDSAAKRLEAIQTLYPFEDRLSDAELKLIYADYQKGEYASSAAIAERYIHLHPTAPHVDYAYYMKALANFQQTRGTLTRIFPIDESYRDPGTQFQAYEDFKALVQRFPQSAYKANALQRMIYLRNLFAQSELNIAEYYFSRKMYVAASHRAGYLINHYPEAPSAERALKILYASDNALGLTAAAKETARVYQASYHHRIH